MPRIIAGRTIREIDALVLDKDGTLIDFEKAWGGRLRRGVRAMADAATGGPVLEKALCRALGADPETGKLRADGPYVSGTIAESCTIAASVIYQAGIAWHAARAIVDATFRPILVAPPLPEELAPIGDVAGFLARAKAAGLRIAVITNDERAGTMAALDSLAIARTIDALVCADDADLAPKPAPDGLLHLARTLGVAPSRTAMVGDAPGDLEAGRAAGCGMVIGVLSGPATTRELAPLADAIVADIHALKFEM